MKKTRVNAVVVTSPVRLRIRELAQVRGGTGVHPFVDTTPQPEGTNWD